MDFLYSGELIVADGGMVTALYDKGFYINRSFEELSVTEAQAVREVTQTFKKAGAQLLSTNTFNALSTKLTTYGLQDRLEEIIRAAVKITSEVAAEDGYVLAEMGPLGVVLEPLGPTSFVEAEEVFRQNIDAFESQSQWIDGYKLVGFHDLKELAVAASTIKKRSDKPILAHIGIQESMKTSFGHTIKEFVHLMDEIGVDVIGFSGEVGPSGMLTALNILRPLTKKPISLAPNAGLPRYINDEYIYMCNPDYIGKYAKRFFQAGANIVGGHSGVHEQHIKAITNAKRMVQSSAGLEVQVGESYTDSLPVSIQDIVDPPKLAIEASKRSLLGRRISEGKKVISVEINPPKGVSIEMFRDLCQQLEESGVEFINIPDGARAMARMGSLQMASFVKNNFNMEPIPHLTTRDRNLIGLQSDLLGAFVNDVRNILVVTGDPPKLGNCPGATAVYDVDSIGLTHIVNRMNQGLDLGGASFGQPTEFFNGVALNPTTENRELEIKRFKYKIEAGAQFAITQPIYDLDSYKHFFEDMGNCDLPIIMGIWPLVSLRNAEFLKNEVPGVSVPDWVLDEMAKAGNSKEEALKRGVDIAIQTINSARELVQGFQVSAPFNKVDVAMKVINTAKE